MISFDFEKTRVTKSQSSSAFKKLLPYIKELNKISPDDFNLKESFVNLSSDKEGIKKIKKLVEKKSSSKLGCVAVIGIGGSSIGANVVSNILGTKIPLIFFDNIDSDLINKNLQILKDNRKSGKHCLVVVVSKSGKTMETIGGMDVVLNWLKKSDKNWRERMVVITDKDSLLHKFAIKEDIDYLDSYREITGRYSFMSATGLFPLAMVGVDIAGLAKGTTNMYKKCLSYKLSDNPAAMGAISLWQNYKSGTNICNNFIFSSRLVMFRDFLRSIMGESLGKEGDGMTPMVSLGTSDMHSMAQLYFGGPRDKFTVLMNKENKGEGIKLKGKILQDEAFNLPGKTTDDIMEAIYSATLDSYNKNKLPYYSVTYDEISPESIGEFMAMKLMETIYLGKLMDINPFDQPNVEDYKDKTRDNLLS